MHRHGYQGRKFGRMRDQRRALIKGLACALVEHHSIETTLPKAKTLRPYVEKLATKARKGGLANRRLVIAKLGNIQLANQLFDQIAPQLQRESGYLRITKTDNRKGDNAPMARIEFVDEIKLVEAKPEAKKPTPKAAATKPAAKAAAPAKASAEPKKGAK